MGYQTDEIVKKNIRLPDEELVKKSREFYTKMESSLGGNLLMAKYSKMNEANRQESRRKWTIEKREYHDDKKTGKADNEIGDQIIRKHENAEKVCIVLKHYKTSVFNKLSDFIPPSGGALPHGRWIPLWRTMILQVRQ